MLRVGCATIDATLLLLADRRDSGPPGFFVVVVLHAHAARRADPRVNDLVVAVGAALPIDALREGRTAHKSIRFFMLSNTAC